MAEKKVLSESIQELTRNLARLPSINRCGDEEVWGLAIDFIDLENSFSSILEDLFPKLLDNNLSLEDLEDVLHDIGEEFRHVAYHLGRSDYYSYLSISCPALSVE